MKSNRFNDFINNDKTSMPANLKEKISRDIVMRLNPSRIHVFLRLMIVQLVVGIIVLVFCPQFGIGFFPDTFLAHLFMMYGDFVCNLICGGIFMGSTVLVIPFTFSADELRVLKHSRFLNFTSISIISLAVFTLLGAEFQFLLYVAWLGGGVLTALLGLNIASRVFNRLLVS
jgi:hypothetical protein